VTSLTLGTWNVQTLLDNPKASRPGRRTALVAWELGRYNVDIAALSETRLAEEGQLTEDKGGYTFFWSGRSVDERRESGVGFAIKTKLIRNLTSLPKGTNDRLMTMQFPIGKNQHATLISACAPTMTNPDDVKDKFYQELHSLISGIPKGDKLVILGDFNARVGADHQTWEGAIGRNGVGKCNSNGLLLLGTCITHDLLITNTVFRQSNRNKTTWMHPRSKHWHLIDYVITRKADRQDVLITRAMCGAECWTDHRLVISKLNLHIQAKRRPQARKTLKRIDVSKLKVDENTTLLTNDLNNKLADLQFGHANVEDDWTIFKDIVHSTSLEVIDSTIRKHQDWFDKNDNQIHDLFLKKTQASPRSPTGSQLNLQKSVIHKHPPGCPEKTAQHARHLARK